MLTQRSQEKELLDLGSDHYTPAEFQHCQTKLFTINRLLGFFSSTVRLLKRFPKDSSVVDVGCGGGLFLLHLSQYFPAMNFLGIDISADAIQIAQHAKKTYPDAKVLFQQTPLDQIKKNTIDILLTTLVCHHMSDEELVEFLRLAFASTQKIVIINDLHRHAIAHWFYGLISPILFRNRLITHDGLISIRRGFIRREWTLLLEKAGIKNYEIKWCFPFRWRVILWKT